MQVHQFLPGMNVGDAVTTHALEIQNILKQKGEDSRIFSVMRHVSPHLKGACSDYREYAPLSNPHNSVIYHFSIGSELTPFFKNLPDKKVIIYHNITPAKFFQGINEKKASDVAEGRKQLNDLAPIPQLALGVSDFNRQELVEAGFRKTGVLPLIIDRSKWDVPPQRKLINLYRDGKVNFLFVGRIAPNKKIEDVIKVFYYYQKTIQPRSRLILVGPTTGMEKYYAYLKAFVMELGVKEVVFTGHVSDSDLKSYYQLADLFLCMSEHEGFCIPLLEAMHYQLPIIAYDACAIGETLGQSGILVKKKDFREVAELAEKVRPGSVFRQKVIEHQNNRLNDFSAEKTAARLKSYLESLTL